LRRPELVDQVRQVVRSCPPTYGYRRVHALLKRRGIQCTPRTVRRILQRQDWLSSSREKTVRPGRRHEGQVAVSVPDTRWASDITEIRAWNGQRVRLAIILDCADRMVLAWRCQPRITGEDLVEMLKDALYARFGTDRQQARGLEFLSDNGTEYLSKDLQRFLAGLGIVACRTPIRSPQSNGMAEAFFGRFKRDYVYQNCLETAEEIRRQVPGWLDDYNQQAPHRALGMKSPCEYHEEWIKSHAKVKITKIPVQI